VSNHRSNELKNARTTADIAAVLREHLEVCYHSGFGVCPSPRDGNFGEQLWARDFSVTTTNYYAKEHPDAAIESLRRILDNQRSDGALPYRVARTYGFLRVVPMLSWLADPAFKFLEGALHGRREKAYFEGDYNGAEDTIPAVVIAAAAISAHSHKGHDFVYDNLGKLKKALDYFIYNKVHQGDKLAVVTKANPDWTETIQRYGKLGYVNVLWVQAVKLLALLCRQHGDTAAATRYRTLYRQARKSLMEKLYDAEGHYFRAKEGEDRLDAAATVLGSLFFLAPRQCVEAQDTLHRRVGENSGLRNFDPPYKNEEISRVPRLGGNGGYHNEFVWPWVTCQNIAVLLKIAARHPDQETRGLAWQEARMMLGQMSDVFRNCGGAPEVVEPKVWKVAKRTPLYTPPLFFGPTCATYHAAFDRLRP
jgi:hypothetical protein